MSRRLRLFCGACAAMFVFGIVLSILGTIFGLPEAHARLHVNLVQQGNVLFALFLGVFVSTVIAGPVIDSFGNKVVLAASALLAAVAVASLGTAASYFAAATASFLLGFGGGGLNTAANALVAEIYPDDRGAMLNLVGIFFGVGALFVPLLAANINLTHLLFGTAALAAACAVAYLLLPFPAPARDAGFSPLDSLRAARTPGVILLASILFFQSGSESSIGGWVSTYIGSLGIRPRTATMILAAYWAAMMIGRIAGAGALRLVSKERLVMLSGIGSAAGCAVLVATSSVPVMVAGAALTGFAYAAIYPTTLAIAADRHPRLAGTIFGFLFAGGLIGGMTFPWAIGHLARRTTLHAAMLLPLLGATVITALAVSLTRRRS